MKQLTSTISLILVLGLLLPGPAAAAEPKTQSMQQDQTTDSQEHYVRPSKFMNMPVVNDQGQDLGRIDEVIFSENGEVRFIVLSRADIEQESENLIPLPFEVVKDSGIAEGFFIIRGLTEEQIASAPRISKNELASLDTDSGQVPEQVRAYFGQE